MPISGDHILAPRIGVQPVAQPIVTNVLERFDDLPIELRERIPVPDARARRGAEVDLGDGVLISATGHFVLKAGADRAADIRELGDALFRAGQIAEEGDNPFQRPGIDVAQKTTLLTELIGAFNAGLEAMPLNVGFENPDQALQIRSSAAPLILDLAESLDLAKPGEAELRKAAVSQYFKLLEKETHGLNRDFMIYDLERSKASLPEDVRPVVDALMAEVGQTTPPYGEWFANGNDTLVVDYHVGSDFWESELEYFTQAGFAREDGPNGAVKMKKTFVENGVETKVELDMHNGKDAIFKRMRDPRVHVVVYSGHASYGRNVTNALRDGAPQAGAKAFFGLHCGGGKGVHNALRGQYPDLHIVQSRNSSYAHQDRTTFLNALRGFARREDWKTIGDYNRRTNSNNYYYPTDTLYRKAAEDRDKDGKLDLWDRVVNYNAFAPKAEIRDQLTSRDPGVPSDRLDGRAFSGAVQRLIRLAGYNEWAQDLENQGVVARGFYDGGAADPIFEQRGVDQDKVEIRLNRHYAHAGEETLGAVLHYRMGRSWAEDAGLAPRDQKLVGLLLASKCLYVDDSNLDGDIWSELLEFEKLPAAIRYNDVLASVREDEHMSAGSAMSLRSLSEKLERQGVQLG